MRKRILVEAFKLTEGIQDGCFRYTLELLKALIRLNQEEPFEFRLEVLIGGKALDLPEVEKVLAGSLASYERKRARIEKMVKIREKLVSGVTSLTPALTGLLRQIDERLKLTKSLEQAHLGTLTKPVRYDLVHLLLPQTFRLVEDLAPSRYLVTIHDCTHRLFPEFHTRDNVETSEHGFQFALEQNASFIAVSESARTDLRRLYDVDGSRVTTIHEAHDPEVFFPVQDRKRIGQLKRRFGIPQKSPYLLALSTLEPRKNLTNTLKAFGRFMQERPDSDVHFVVAGRLGWKYDRILSDLGEHENRVHFTDFVPEADMAPLYSGADAFSFVSYYEGFGLPAVESMACGVPVIYGDRGSLPEVVGPAGLTAEPDDVEQIAQRFAALTGDSELRSKLSRAALQRAAEFSWDETARKTVEVYRSLLAGESTSLGRSKGANGDAAVRFPGN